jgi:hypothetical protein
LAEHEEIHFDGAKMVEPPGVPGDGVGEFAFDDGFGVEVFDDFGFELFEDGAVGIREGEDLPGEAVAQGVAARFGFSLSLRGPVDFSAFLRFASICF